MTAITVNARPGGKRPGVVVAEWHEDVFATKGAAQTAALEGKRIAFGSRPPSFWRALLHQSDFLAAQTLRVILGSW